MAVPKTKVAAATMKHEVIYQDLLTVLKRYERNTSAQELLAVTSNLVGKLIAMQDQRKMTLEMAMQVVMDNIHAGNAHAVRELMNPVGNA